MVATFGKESKTPKDFETASDFYFSITQDESEITDIAKKVKDIYINNEQLETYIKLIKKDKDTGKLVSASSATFKIRATEDIYDRGNNKIIYKKGEIITQKIGSTTYSSFTTNADNIIVPADSYNNKDDDIATVITPLMLEVGSYELFEVLEPTGFLLLQEPIKFTVEGIRDYDQDEDGDYIKTIEIFNEQPTGTIILDKSIVLRDDVDTSLIDTSDYSKIQFRLTAKEDIIDRADNSVIHKAGAEIGIYNLTEKGDLKIENLHMGSYELEEISVFGGLVLDNTKYTVEFKQNDNTTKVYTKALEIENETTITEFSKTDITGEKEIIGAELEVLDENGNVVDSWTTTEETHKIEGLVAEKTYTLIEKICVEGYVKATEIQFTVSNTNEIQKVTMIDKIVEISKQDIAGNEIEGATLQVLDEERNVIDEWISTSEPHKVSGLEENKNYWLHEEICVDGYVKATDIQFTVTADKETQKIIMVDKIVEISKQDIAGNEIEGATLQVLDEEKNVIDEWISTSKPHKVSGLEENKNYWLHEEICVDGYVKATDIQFTVTADKETQKVVMIDKILIVSKVDITTGEELEGAKLKVLDENDNVIDEWISSKEPHIVKGLEENRCYRLVEEIAPYGFLITETIEFTVSEDKETQKVVMKDMPILTTVKLTKIDEETKEVIKEKFTFGIYEDEACTKLIKEIESDKKEGTIIFEDLRFSTVFVKELSAPKGYILSDKIIKIEINSKGVFVDNTEIKEENSIYNFEFTNKKIDTPKTSDERNTMFFVIAFIISTLGITTISIVKYKKRKKKQ